MTVLLISADEKRLSDWKEALQRADFHNISARSIAEAWSKVEFFDIRAVVIDPDLADDIGASAFRKSHIWTLERQATPEAIVADLSQVLRGGSDLVQ